jgi:hypothetical protein
MIKLFQKRVEWKPVRGSFGPAGHSAFRVLGLSATASQREVFDAAAAVRLALKLGVRKTFDGDLEWLGEVARGETEVRDAVGRLSAPVERARERLLWFHGRLTNRPAASVAELMRTVDSVLHDAAGAQVASGNGRGAEGYAATLHDAALLALAGLACLDPLLNEENAWARALGLWARLWEGEEFWSLLVAADLKGEYEPAVNFGEAASLRALAPRLVSQYVAERARDAAQREDLRAALRAFRLLRGARLPRALLQEYERETFGPLEDSLTAKIEEAVHVPAYVTFGAPLRNHSNKAWRRFCLLQPGLASFVELAGADSYAVRRVFEHASANLLRLAESFETAGCYRESVYVCRLARSLAPPASEKLPEIESKLRALDAGEGLAERTFEQYAVALPRVLPEVRVPPDMFKDDPRGGTTLDGAAPRAANASGGLTSCLFWLLMVAVGVGVRACIGASSGPRYPVNSLPRLTMPPPDLNFNYNVAPPNVNLYRPPSNLNIYRPPSNLNLYRPESPRAVRPREGRRGKRNANAPRE